VVFREVRSLKGKVKNRARRVVRNKRKNRPLAGKKGKPYREKSVERLVFLGGAFRRNMVPHGAIRDKINYV